MNTLKVTGKGDFADEVLQSGKIERRLGLISDELPIDTLTFFVYKEVASQKAQYLLDKNLKPLVSSDGHFLAVKRSTGSVIDNVVPGDEIIVYYTYSSDDAAFPNDEVKIGQFFVESVETINSILFKISCYSYLGILNKSVHEGGVYTNYSALDLIDELTYPARSYGFTYTVDPDVTALDDTLSGWLPYGNCADNLLHVLFATGWVMTPAPGSVRGYILTTPGKESATISNANTDMGRRRLYDEGGISKLDNAETVRLVEHAYFSSPADRLVTLFDNSADTAAANNAIIVFNEPCHGTFTTTGTLTAETHDNYAIVSGNGSLTGYAYSHSQRQLEAETDVINNGKVISVENETLVSFTNSKNVLERLVNNQNADQSTRLKFRPIPLGESPYHYNQVGSKLTYKDMGNVTRTGFINSIDYNMSAYPAIDADLLLGFIPGPYGMNVDAEALFTQDQGTSFVWRVPLGVTEISIVLGGGGEGGQGGFDGEPGENGTVSYYSQGATVGVCGMYGNGGDGGIAGASGNIYRSLSAISVTPGDTIYITLGEYGDGGSRNGDFGRSGGDTTLEVGGVIYSSANGTHFPTGYSDPLSGILFSLDGEEGKSGGRGGSAHAADDMVYNPQGNDRGRNGYLDLKTTSGYTLQSWGGGGGGGVGTLNASRNGEDGIDGFIDAGNEATAGDGGNGAWADIPEETTTYGGGGNGGHGGGGGGGGGGVLTVNPNFTATVGDGGQGGRGSAGGDGGFGWAIIYYRAS